MNQLAMTMLIALVSFAGGAAIAMLIARSRGNAVPATGATSSSASGDTRTAVQAIEAPLELHLVFNALNRVVMALNTDERMQDGVADMASYLRAWHELQRRPSQGAVVQQLSAYWRLSRWLHGQSTDALHIEAQVPDLPLDLLYRIAGELTNALRDQEICSKADTSIRLTTEKSRSGSRLIAAHIAIAGAPQAVHAALVALPRGWTSDSKQLSLRLEWAIAD